jgi:ParB/RepB/Spo0J family partition protein
MSKSAAAKINIPPGRLEFTAEDAEQARADVKQKKTKGSAETARPTISEILLPLPPDQARTGEDGAYRIVDFGLLRFDRANNVRSRYDEEAAESLKETIKTDGILQNLLVVANADGTFDGVGGFRRYSATEALLFELAEAGETELMLQRRRIPIKVLTADQAARARELQLIENLQREAVDAVDEARGYQRLLEERTESGERKYTYESLAAALGVPRKGPWYIRKRINLLSAPDFLLDAIRELGMSPRIGERVGKIPNKKDREEMARRAIKHPQLGIPMNLEQVDQMIREEFMVSLKGVEWNLEEAEVLDDNERKMLGFLAAAGADNDGSCARCPHRTGCDPLLQDQVSRPASAGGGRTEGIDPNLCQNTRCFELKAAAAWRTVERLARDQGNRLMDKEQAKRLWENGAFQGPLAGQYVRRDWRPDFSFTGHFGEETMPTWQELLAGEKVSWLLVRNPNKKGTVYLLERQTAIDLVEAKCQREGVPNPFANRPGARGTTVAPENEEDGIERADDEVVRHEVKTAGAVSNADVLANASAAAERRKASWRRMLMDRLDDALRQNPTKAMTAEVWEPLVLWIVDLVLQLEHQEFLMALTGEDWPEGTDPQEIADSLTNAYEKDGTQRKQLRWAILLLMGAEMGGSHCASEMRVTETGDLICRALGVDVAKLRDLATEAVPEPKAEEPAAKSTKAMEALTIPERAFLKALLEEEVKETKPNKHGVFERPMSKTLGFDAKHQIEITLAVDEGGAWYSATSYRFGTSSGGGLPNVREGRGSREDAVAAAIREVMNYRIIPEGKPGDTKGMRKPREAVARLVAAIEEIQLQPEGAK